jgi:glycosyltransferase involved in cell wall biosynthesis
VTRPLVSVVVPSRDRPGAVAPAVETARAQTYTELEIVVVDDASARPVSLSPDALADERVRLVRSERRLGAGGARNHGVALSTGQLIAFLDDDDAWAPDKLARQVASLAEHGSATAAVEVGSELWDDGRLLFQHVPNPGEDVARTLLRVPRMQPSTVMLKRDAFDDLGGFDATMRRVEDWEFWIRLSERYAIAVVPDVLVQRQLNPDFPPDEALDGFRELRRRLNPRLAQLPARERGAIVAAHDAQEGLLLYLTGRRREAFAMLAASWARDRRSLRAARTAVRLVVGERAWRHARRTAFGLRARPVVRRW